MEEVTSNYLDLFPEDTDPIPIYRVDLSDLNIANRILSRFFRKPVYGQHIAAEYRHGGIGLSRDIRITKGVSERFEEEIIKHEINHYVSRTGETPLLQKISSPFILLGAGLITAGIFTSEILFSVGTGMIFTSFAITMYDEVFMEEKRAEKGVDLDTAYKESDIQIQLEDGLKLKLLDKLEMPVGIITMPFGGLSLRYKQIKTCIKSILR